MNAMIDVFVPGKPVPQGSKRYVGRGIMVESSKTLTPWRADIREHLLARFTGAPITGPVTVELEFALPRPASTPKSRTPPAIRRPDVDKLARAVLDAIGSAGIWRDDSQVVHLTVHKRLAERDERSGCRIQIGGAE